MAWYIKNRFSLKPQAHLSHHQTRAGIMLVLRLRWHEKCKSFNVILETEHQDITMEDEHVLCIPGEIQNSSL